MKITQQQLNQIILEEIIKHLHEEGLLDEGFMSDFGKKTGKIGAGLALGATLMGAAPGVAQAGPRNPFKKHTEPTTQTQAAQEETLEGHNTEALKEMERGKINYDEAGNPISVSVSSKASSSSARMWVTNVLNDVASEAGLSTEGAWLKTGMVDGVFWTVATAKVQSSEAAEASSQQAKELEKQMSQSSKEFEKGEKAMQKRLDRLFRR